jgi:cell division protease FtsH
MQKLLILSIGTFVQIHGMYAMLGVNPMLAQLGRMHASRPCIAALSSRYSAHPAQPQQHARLHAHYSFFSSWKKFDDVEKSITEVKKPLPEQPAFIHTPVSRDSVRGLSRIKGEIPVELREIADLLKNEKKYRRMGAEIPRGLLVVGAPGVGKTYFVSALAEETNIPLVSAVGGDFSGGIIGTEQERIKKLFKEAEVKASLSFDNKAIIFIDEIDALGTRGKAHQHIAYSQAITTMLHMMDGIKTDKNIFMVGATNNANDLDPALKRSGRFDRIVTLKAPNVQSRYTICKFYADFTRYDSERVDLHHIAKITEGWSCADLKNLANEAAIAAVRANDDHISQKHYEQAFDLLKKRKEASTQDFIVGDAKAKSEIATLIEEMKKV